MGFRAIRFRQKGSGRKDGDTVSQVKPVWQVSYCAGSRWRKARPVQSLREAKSKAQELRAQGFPVVIAQK